MKVIFSMKAADLDSSATVVLTLDSALYWEVKEKIDAFANELIAINNKHLNDYAAYYFRLGESDD